MSPHEPSCLLIKGTTTIKLVEDMPPMDGEFPWYDWEIRFESADEDKYPLSKYVSKCTLELHESFPEPVRKFKSGPFVVKERGWGEFTVEATFHFVTGERAKFKYPLLFEDGPQEKLFETKVLLDESLLKIKDMPLKYQESFLRDLSDKLCALSEAEMRQVHCIVSESLESGDYFYKLSGAPSSQKTAVLKFNLNMLSPEAMGRLCQAANYDGEIQVLESAAS